MVLSKEHPQVIRYRSAEPVLTPCCRRNASGTVANVVFPTGIDRRDDLGLPNRFDVYYGMADNRIGVARLDMPDFLPPEGVARLPGSQGVISGSVWFVRRPLGVNLFVPITYFAGNTSDNSRVSASGWLPEGSPFCCSR